MGLIRSGQRCIAFDELQERGGRVASGLAAVGVGDGGAVAVMLRNDIPFLECMLATAALGAYFVPVNWHSTSDELKYVLEDCGARHLVIHADLLDPIRHLIPENVMVLVVAAPPEIREAYAVPPEHAAVPRDCIDWDTWRDQFTAWRVPAGPVRGSMVYTSGTTGRPKAVKREPVPAENRHEYARLRAEWFGMRPGLRTAMVGPLYHSVQTTYAYAALRSDGSVTLRPKFDAEEVLRLIDGEKLTHLHLVPTMMWRLVNLPESVRTRYDLSSLEFVVHGAAPCPPEIKRQLIEWWGPCVHEYYGTSELGMISRASSAEWLEREGTVGRAWTGRTIRILDEQGQELPPNTEGLVYMSLGPVPDFTYHNAHQKRVDIEQDGLITNGDIGYLDQEGYLFLRDRRQDVIISGGVNIWPAEVEGVLASHPGVHDCAVFGIPDAEFGEAVHAVVQPAEGHRVSTEELRAHVASRLARFKVPRHIDLRDVLPRDDSGKVFRRLLREPYWAGAGRRI